MTIKDRIELFISYRGIKRSVFEKACGFSNGYTRNLKENPSATKIEDILIAYPELNRVWLLSGEGEMLKDSSEGVAVVTENDGDAINCVPLIPTDALANPLAEYIGNGVKRVECEMVVSPVPGAEFAIQVSGDSMEPKFPDGCYVFMKRINDELFIPWGNTMVLDTENGAYIKNVFPITGKPDYIEARSINPRYPAFEIPKRAIFGMYRVLGMAKTYTMM